MPELPDVEVFRRYLASTALHKKIAGVEVFNGRILKGTRLKLFKKNVSGRSMEDTDRHGKYLFAVLDNGSILALHFGMTGFLRYFKNPEKEPDHPRMAVHFKQGYRLVYDDQRLLGSVSLLSDKDEFIRKKKLGPDALAIGSDDFDTILKNGRGCLKTTLMNQNSVAGIGNIYADEIMFQARMHPKADVHALTQKQRLKLYRAMQYVLSAAIESGADPNAMPDTFLLPHRNPGDRCPRCPDRIKKITISGRSSYFCPTCQKMH